MSNREAENIRFEDKTAMQPAEILQEFVNVFANKGWLNKLVRIKHRERNYRISCNESGFIAYRINDNHGVSPGIPGWAVCIIDSDRIVEDSELSAFTSTEPSARDWLVCISQDDLEVL